MVLNLIYSCCPWLLVSECARSQWLTCILLWRKLNFWLRQSTSWQVVQRCDLPSVKRSKSCKNDLCGWGVGGRTVKYLDKFFITPEFDLWQKLLKFMNLGQKDGKQNTVKEAITNRHKRDVWVLFCFSFLFVHFTASTSICELVGWKINQNQECSVPFCLHVQSILERQTSIHRSVFYCHFSCPQCPKCSRSLSQLSRDKGVVTLWEMCHFITGQHKTSNNLHWHLYIWTKGTNWINVDALGRKVWHWTNNFLAVKQ